MGPAPVPREPAALLTLSFSDDGSAGWRVVSAWQDLAARTHVLSADERARCDAMNAADTADLRRAAHAFKRNVVGAHLGIAAGSVPFAAGDGVPRLLPPHDGTHVSLSHTDGAVAVAVAATPVGVDVERIDRVDDAVRLASRYFAPAEATLIAGSKDAPFEFAWRWTAKEALLKACALMLRDALATDLGDMPRTRSATPFDLRARGAHITVFTFAPGYVCSVAKR